MTNKETEMFYKQAMSFLGQGETRKAIDFFNKALEFDNQYLPALNNKGVALIELKDYRQAEECFGMVVKLNPADRMALYNRGYALLMLEEYQKSVEIFDFFLANISRKNDFFKFGLYLQSKGFYGLNEHDKAVSLLNDALKVDKKFKEAQDLLNQVLKEKKKIEN